MNIPRILIVEDEAITAMDIKSNLEDLGYEVPGIADSGKEAIALAEKLKPDLIFMDIVLKGEMDGTEAAIHITNHFHIPIVFLTAYNDKDTFSRAKLSDPYGYLSKPFESRELGITVDLALFKHEIASKLAASEVRFHNAFTYAATGMGLLNPNGEFIQANQALCNMLGYEEKELLTLSLANLNHPSDLEVELFHVKELLLNKIQFFKLEKRYQHKLGHVVWGTISVSLVRDKNESPLYFIFQIEDISLRKLAENQVVHLTYHDVLTGLPKLDLLEDFVEQSLITARRYSKQFAILFLGIDYFKRINDTMGHEAGDRLLQAVGERLRKEIRSSDFVAKLGGDIFALVLTDVTQLLTASAVAQKIQRSFLHPFTINKQDFYITMSIGISLYPDNGKDSQMLIKNADIGLSRAKNSGRNNYQFCTSEMTELAQERVTIENKLHSALENQEFILYYQPQVSLQTGKIVGVEALLRWKQEGKEPTIPKELISVAEETGFIVPIGTWALRAACQQSKAWEMAGFKLENVSVNVSSRQFFEEDLIKTIQIAMKDFDVDNLELEITESMLMHDVELATKQLNALSKAGLKIALDDFGTGYSSLSYLRQFPINKLKLDQAFVRNSASSKSDAAMMNAIVTLGHTLNLKVIAEGVETKEQLKLLCDYGCDEIQGYYFSRPIPADEVTLFLKEGRSLVFPD